jgi:integral membrane sensor domain MASE1
MKAPLLIIALPLAYLGAGLLCFLVVPPGYATPIFLPAGLAVAATFLAGSGALPGTFLGSFLLNIMLGHLLTGGFNSAQTNAALIVAAASMIQAAIAGATLRLLRFERPAHVFLFFALAPIFCLVSATLSLGGLCLIGIVARSELSTNWLMWWLGDLFGVLLALPVIMWFGDSHDNHLNAEHPI